MIVDTDGSECVTTNFGIGGGSPPRSWDIMVIIHYRHNAVLLLITSVKSKYVCNFPQENFIISITYKCRSSFKLMLFCTNICRLLNINVETKMEVSD